MTRVMNVHSITCLAVLSHTSKGVHNVFSRGRVISSVVHQDKLCVAIETRKQEDSVHFPGCTFNARIVAHKDKDCINHFRVTYHILFLESLLADQVLLGILNVIVATTELSFLSGVIDPNQDGSLGTIASQSFRRNNEEAVVDIQHFTTGQLRDLIKALLEQNGSHFVKEIDPAHGLTLVFCQDTDQGRRTSTACLSRWIGQFKGSDIEDIGRRLFIFRSTDHVELGLDLARDFIFHGHDDGGVWSTWEGG